VHVRGVDRFHNIELANYVADCDLWAKQDSYLYIVSIFNKNEDSDAYARLLRDDEKCCSIINFGFSTLIQLQVIIQNYFVCKLHPFCYQLCVCPRLSAVTPALPHRPCAGFCGTGMPLHDLEELPDCQHLVCLDCLNRQVLLWEKDNFNYDEERKPSCPVKGCEFLLG
jgi:hypothetical protein